MLISRQVVRKKKKKKKGKDVELSVAPLYLFLRMLQGPYHSLPWLHQIFLHGLAYLSQRLIFCHVTNPNPRVAIEPRDIFTFWLPKPNKKKKIKIKILTSFSLFAEKNESFLCIPFPRALLFFKSKFHYHKVLLIP